jgi:hypothetical protein
MISRANRATPFESSLAKKEPEGGRLEDDSFHENH